MRDAELIARIDGFCDASPRLRARAEEHGPLVLFAPTGPGFPYYARPRLGRRPVISGSDVRTVRARQRELMLPESFEWIEQAAPDLARAAAEGGLAAHRHPLLVLAGPVSGPAWLPPGITTRLISPEDPALSQIWAVPSVAFRHPGTAAGPAGPAERDKIAAQHEGATLAMLRERLRNGVSVLAAAFDAAGPVAAGSCQSLADVAEITGVGVLPSHRRQGLAAAITATLAGDAVRRGAGTVFLSAADQAVARIYQRTGFRPAGIAMIAEPPEHR